MPYFNAPVVYEPGVGLSARGVPIAGGTGATAFNQLQDATDVDILAINAPLANAISQLTPKNSPVLTGTPSAPTAPPGTSTAQLATTAFAVTAANAAVANLIGAAPSTLDKIDELAAALGNDANYAVAVAAQIANLQAGVNTKSPGGPTVAITTSTTITAAAHDGRNLDVTSATDLVITLNSATTLVAGFGVMRRGTGDVTFDGTATLVGAAAVLNDDCPRLAVIPTSVAGTFEVVAMPAGAGATNAADLLDIDSIDLPTVNGPLADRFDEIDAALGAATAGTLGALTSSGNTLGSVLTFTPATGLTGTMTWKRDGVAISGATSLTYTLVEDDIGGKVIRPHFVPTSFTPGSVTTGAAAPAGSLSITTPAVAGENLTAGGYLFYKVLFDRANGTNDPHPTNPGVVGPTLVGGMARQNATVPSPITLSGTDNIETTGDWGATFSILELAKFSIADNTSAVRFTFPADTTARKARIFLGTFGDSGAGQMGAVTVRFTLSDGSFTEQTAAPAVVDGSLAFAIYQATYSAASAAQTLTVSFEATNGTASAQMFVGMVSYDTVA
jgi:hypothetical protein